MRIPYTYIYKPQYRKINTIYTIIPALNKYDNTCKRVSDHSKCGNNNESKNIDKIVKMPINSKGVSY